MPVSIAFGGCRMGKDVKHVLYINRRAVNKIGNMANDALQFELLNLIWWFSAYIQVFTPSTVLMGLLSPSAVSPLVGQCRR